ncbi:hypothetical protein [Pseudobutyrivibrio sp.]
MSKEKNNGKVFYIDATYIHYRRLWKQDRWKFSGDLVKLNIAKSRNKLTEEQSHQLETMNRVVEENDGNWLDDYEWSESTANRIKKKQKEKGLR